MKDFSFWVEYEGAAEGSGRSEKLWLMNPDTGQTGLFKFKKRHRNNRPCFRMYRIRSGKFNRTFMC